MNRTFTLKKGAVGTTIQFQLTKAGLPADLTGQTVTMTARDGAGAKIIDNGACTLITPATGIGKYVFTAVTAEIAVGEYTIEFKGVLGSDVQFFPTNPIKPYGRLIVQANLED